jgi:hypothetical protein
MCCYLKSLPKHIAVLQTPRNLAEVALKFKKCCKNAARIKKTKSLKVNHKRRQ